MSDNPADHTHTYAELRRDAENAMHQMLARCGKEIDPDLVIHSGMFFAEVRKMFEIVQEMATTDSTTYHENLDQVECPFCNGRQPDWRVSFGHEIDCIVVKARELVGQQPT